MQTIKEPTFRIWFEPSLIKEPSNLHFTADYWAGQNKVIGSAQGRGTTYFLQLDSLQAALRHYRRGGLFGKLVQDSYWFCGWENTRSYQEYQVLLHLKRNGVNVPTPVAAFAQKTGLTYKADLISEKINHARDLVEVLSTQSLPAGTYQLIGNEIAKMHLAGVNHTDLNIHNILLDAQGVVWIIDFDKCALNASSSKMQGNLERLHRSFAKELNKRNIQWSEQDWQYLLQGYRTVWSDSPLNTK